MTEHTENSMNTLDVRRVRPAYLHSAVTERILGAFYNVYRELGFGFLESNYKAALEIELRQSGLAVEREVPVAVTYRGTPIGQCRLDMVVEDLVVVEVKSTKAIGVADERQLLNYLSATKYEVGLLLHFGPAAKPRRLVLTNDVKGRKATTVH